MTEKEFAAAKKKFLTKHKSFNRIEKKYPIPYRIKVGRSPFESMVRSIAFQQIHGKAAEAILGRFLLLYKPKRFPNAKDILATSDQAMRDCGFSATKVKSIKDIAMKFEEGIVPSLAKAKRLSNEEIIERLVSIFGVGRWTVEMFLIFGLGRMDVWPVDDFGVRKGYMVWKKLDEMPKPKELKPVGEKFAPYQSLLALYMWEIANVN